jgi:hypothetical protein
MTDDSAQQRQPDEDLMELEQALRDHLARTDPVPAAVTRHAVEAFALRRLDEELAEIVWDSLVDSTALTRGPEQTRVLTFASVHAPARRIEVELVRTATGWDVTGQVDPAGAGEIRIGHRDGTLTRPVDVLGRFDASLPLVAALRLWCRSGAAADEAPLVTAWVPIG